MEYEVHEDLIQQDTFSDDDQKEKVNLPLKKLGAIISDLMPRARDINKKDVERKTRQINSHIQEMLSQDVIPGDGDDWHNLTVDLARNGYYDLACDILERGLIEFPRNTDLLGDYLEYGISCGRIDKCKTYYKVLQKIPRVKYTWRGFHFSVSWLSHLWQESESPKEMDRLENEMMNLVKDYRHYLPEDEESYRCEAEIYKLLKQRDEEIKALQKALDTGYPAPKCALRLAHINFDRGNYAAALHYAQQCLAVSNNSIQDDVNTAFVYYLSGLCKMAIHRTADGAYIADEIDAVYSDFNLSLKADDRSKFVDQIAKRASLLQHQSNTKIPAEYKILREVLQARRLLG